MRSRSRMLTNWGDRATSKVAAQKLITSLVDWEVLRSTKTKGHFLLARKMTASTPDLQLWLLEALLGASASDEIEAQQLLRLPESFPFTISVGVSDLRRSEAFDIHRQGLDMDMVALRKIKREQPTALKKKTTKAAKQDHPSLFDSQRDDVDSSIRKSDVTPFASATTSPVNENQDGASEQSRIEEFIKNEVLQTLSDRAARYLQVRGMFLVPSGPFAAPSVECVEQFRDGHYFGCIALTQAVVEAVIRHIWKVELKTKPKKEGSFEKNLEALHKRKVISDDWKTTLDQMWAERHSFHHLRPSVESNQQKLEDKARNTLNLLNELEREFFGFSLRDGMLLPDHPEYWSLTNGESLVFLRGHG